MLPWAHPSEPSTIQRRQKRLRWRSTSESLGDSSTWLASIPSARRRSIRSTAPADRVRVELRHREERVEDVPIRGVDVDPGADPAGAVQVGLLVAALTDLWRRPSDQLRGRKAMSAALSCVNFVGPLAYFKFGRRR
jgi:hypothetical protein